MRLKGLYVLKNGIVFFSNHFNIKGRVLDFGCGPGHAIHIAKKCGLNNITGLDVDQRITNDDDIFFKLQHKFGVYDDIVFYDGGTKIPFKDNEFDAIICCSSIKQDNTLKNTKSLNLAKENVNVLEERIKELIRISNSNTIWYVAPTKDWEKVVVFFNKYNNKNIKYDDLSKYFGGI